ncbi:MAG: hypothetical protein L0H53_05270 [Candidatus Nitrosocosmicus sp.]|nr:hypothetical protein [Candidatus Nitrosocosmicus sp.]
MNINILITNPKSNGEIMVLAQTVSHVKGKNYVLLNTTDTRNCPEFYNNPVQSNSTSESSVNATISIPHIKSGLGNITESIEDNKTITNICPFLKIMYPYDCSSEVNKSSEIMCKVNDVLNDTDVEELEEEEDNILASEEVLDNEIFDEKGLLIADTKFNKQYSYELIDPLNSDKKIRVNLDLGKHSQGHNNDINSPRIEIQRENIDGSLDMKAAKNQMIIWKGNILDYFEEPEDKFDNETYIEIMFNTGFHASDAPDNERRGIGVVFDVSNTSNPYIMDYRDDGRYLKLTMNDVKNLAGDDFIFHSTDNKSKDYFLNDLTNTTNVMFKVKTFLTADNKRVIEVHIDPGTGKEILYWTLKDSSKLQYHEEIRDRLGFIETLYQGSGFTYVRTDNIETRLASLQSVILS